ncbi:MAG: hypothetical protein COV10_04275 [Candidatus Vogelbacteria bacterium CG10_big_fil_rev_8_21_14_0_10_51_16]|uniref:Uncharacterized protein n=1 Tax=Candidatus Vogelbacteria bacterium CG10_big_fil_rev_8_21_14_0_10_51_16 TaxID=1975045 RepID=A0A2H0RDK0_9BACT|nr:MAG: hypothetical protein COV10_04275 [Candidatus Vogelbacteria bacterium CG10_big_fil_rev_8_21_14_0_10_51_16]
MIVMLRPDFNRVIARCGVVIFEHGVIYNIALWLAVAYNIINMMMKRLLHVAVFTLITAVVFMWPVENAWAAFGRDLAPGSRGEDVRELQRFLNKFSAQTRVADYAEGSPGQETAYYGSLTANAVLRFQLMPSQAITERDGLFRGATRARISELMARAGASSSILTTAPPAPAVGGSLGVLPWGPEPSTIYQLPPATTPLRLTHFDKTSGTVGSRLLVYGEGLVAGDTILFLDKDPATATSYFSGYAVLLDSPYGLVVSIPAYATFTCPTCTFANKPPPQPLQPGGYFAQAVKSSGQVSNLLNFSVLPEPPAPTPQPPFPGLPQPTPSTGNELSVTGHNPSWPLPGVSGFALSQNEVVSGQTVTLTFARPQAVHSYRVRLDCPSDVKAQTATAQEFCRATNAIKVNASPLTLRFSNSGSFSQSARLEFTAHDASGRVLDGHVRLITVLPSASATIQSGDLSLSIEGVATNGTSLVTLPAGGSLNRTATVRLNGNLTGGPRSVQLALAPLSFSATEAYLTPTTLTLSPGGSATAQLRITPASLGSGLHRVTVSATVGGIQQTQSFALSFGSDTSGGGGLADLALSYNGPTSISRNTTLNAVFSLRESTSNSFPATSVRLALYDPMTQILTGGNVYGYEPQTFTDSQNIIATQDVTVSSGYFQNSLNLGGGFAFSLPGTYRVCASVDQTNLLLESSKINNVACGTVTVF